MGALMDVLSAGEQDDCRDDMPVFSSQAVAPAGAILSGDGKKAASKTSALISCGSRVRVVKSDRSRRAATDVKEALGRKPPPPVVTQKQLRELNSQIQAALEDYRRLNGPLAKELAKVSIALRGINNIRS